MSQEPGQVNHSRELVRAENGNRTFANTQPPGVEFFQLWQSAAQEADRACFYRESSENFPDWQMLPFGGRSFEPPPAGLFMGGAWEDLGDTGRRSRRSGVYPGWRRLACDN